MTSTLDMANRAARRSQDLRSRPAAAGLAALLLAACGCGDGLDRVPIQGTVTMDGQPLSSTFMDYLIPTIAEVPRIQLCEMATPSPLHPYGAKGAAEGAYLTAPAAIASAVEDALAPLELSIDTVPITPDGLFQLLASTPRPARVGDDSSSGREDITV